MDKFMEMAKKVEQMSPEEKKQVIEKLRSMCICGGCPTYNACMREKDELLFCSKGKSACKTEMKACICPNCPVTKELGLTRAYYCVKGSEKELRGL